MYESLNRLVKSRIETLMKAAMFDPVIQPTWGIHWFVTVQEITVHLSR